MRSPDDNNARGYFELEGGKIITQLREDVIMLPLDRTLLPKATKLSGRLAGPETSSPDTAFAQIRISPHDEIPKGTQSDFWPASRFGGQMSHPPGRNYCVLSECAVLQTQTAVIDRAICDLSGLVRMQGFLETYDVLRIHANDAAARAVNVRYEKKRDGHNKR